MPNLVGGTANQIGISADKLWRESLKIQLFRADHLGATKFLDYDDFLIGFGVLLTDNTMI